MGSGRIVTVTDRATIDEADDPPSKSARKRTALAVQKLGQQLVALRDTDLVALELPERIADAIRSARRITSHGALARQHQYIGKLMRDIDTDAIVTALAVRSHADAGAVEQHQRTERWRERLLTGGPAALNELCSVLPNADRGRIAALVQRASAVNASDALKTTASRQLFRVLNELVQSRANIPR